MASKDIRVPDLGDFKDVAVIDVLAKPGESVQVDTPLITLESEKATMDVPSSDAGVIEALHVSKGSKVSAGTVIATLRVEQTAAAGKPAATDASTAPATAPEPPARRAPAAAVATSPAAPAGAAIPATTTTPAGSAPSRGNGADRSAVPAGAASAPVGPESADRTAVAALVSSLSVVDEQAFARAHASPSVRRFARELGVDLGRVRGSGLKGRVTEADVKSFVKGLMSAAQPGGALPRVAVPDFAQFGPIEVHPLGRIARIAGPRLTASWVNLPHVTQFEEADVTELEEARERLKGTAGERGIRLTTLAFVVRACVAALKKFPQFNSSLDASGENLIRKHYIHIGFAADTPQGLLVPVIRDADRRDVYEIARSLGELAEKARQGKLSPAEMQGGSFTISSLGGIGGTAFTPIINAPEVAILGVSRAAIKPVYRDGQFVPRRMLPLSLSYDHRVIDGAAGARFSAHLASLLADANSLLEAVP